MGGARPDGSSDIQVQTDWCREAGVILRRDGDYFWRAVGCSDGDQSMLVSGGVVPIDGSARLNLHRVSPLSRSAVLTLDPPHRFGGHIDRVVLVDQTVLIGPSPGDHIRCTSIETSAVIFVRDGVWRAKLKSFAPGAETRRAESSEPVELIPGQRVSLGELDMMLEKV